MKKQLAVILAAVMVLFPAGCAAGYHAEAFLGKTSAEIIDQYGAFDCIGMPADSDGLYRNCRCGYTVREARKGFLGTSPEILFLIAFDENGIAVECSEGDRPGG